MSRIISNKIGASTSCLGLHPSHNLDSKLRAAAGHGMQGVEIVFGDLEIYSQKHNVSLLDGAKQIHALCKELSIQAFALVPFEQFEGSRTPLQQRLEKAKRWIEVARTLGAEFMQVPAQFGKDVVRDEAIIVSEFQQLADLGSSDTRTIKIAYEPMSWSTCYSTWQDALRLSEKVNRKNFGICLDTFHIASKLYGDCGVASGFRPNAEQNLASDLKDYLRNFPLEKLFYVQLSDGEKFEIPWSSTHPWYDPAIDKEFCWSMYGRPFPYETEFGGYFPVTDMVRAWVVEKGFGGWVSFETFDRRMRDEKYRIEDAATRAAKSLERLRTQLKAGTPNL